MEVTGGLPSLQMESIRTVKGLIRPGDWLLKLDLKDAYLTREQDRPAVPLFPLAGPGNYRYCPLDSTVLLKTYKTNSLYHTEPCSKVNSLP